MDTPIYAGIGYPMKLGTAAGTPASTATQITASTGYTESVSINGARAIRILIVSDTSATGTLTVVYSDTMAFTNQYLAATIDPPAADNPLCVHTDTYTSGFVRVYNGTDKPLTATIQVWM